MANSDTEQSTAPQNAARNLFAPPVNRLQLVFGALLLAGLALAVYRPILPGSFLMDDWRLIAGDNPLVTGEFTAYNLWFQTDFTLSTFISWLQYLVWGHNPAGYHVINILLHATSGILLWRLLSKLKIPGAWLAAALYVVHPVCVNSVARAAEIKNTLSLPFFLLSIWAYLHYETRALFPEPENPDAASKSRHTPAAVWYALALLAFIAALLSKTSTIMLPLVLLACAVWQRNRLTIRDGLHTAPFFALSVAFGLMSIWFQKHQALFSAGETLRQESFGERLAIAGHIVWFYLGKALLPLNLNLVYAQWQPDASRATAYLPVLAIAILLAVCWIFRSTWGRHVLLAVAYFGITLFPALGFFDSQFLATWQVSDHLQYLSLIAPVALLAAAMAALIPRKIIYVLGILLVVVTGLLTFQRATVFASEETLMRDTIAKNPAAGKAHNDLGVILARRNDLAGATEQFKAAVQYQPDNPETRSNYGQALAMNGDLAGAEAQFQAAVKTRPSDADAHKKYAGLLQHEQRYREAALQYHLALLFKPDVQTRIALAALCHQTGDPAQAISQLQQILRQDPDNLEALNNLAWLFATWGDNKFRNGAEAVWLAEKACQLTANKQPRATGTLAAAYAEAGRFPEAVTAAEATVKLANESGDQRLAYLGNQLLSLYRANQPYHEPPVSNQP